MSELTKAAELIREWMVDIIIPDSDVWKALLVLCDNSREEAAFHAARESIEDKIVGTERKIIRAKYIDFTDYKNKKEQP